MVAELHNKVSKPLASGFATLIRLQVKRASHMQASDRTNFERLRRQAEFLLQNKRYSQAIDYALKARAIFPDDPRPYIQVAYAKARLKDQDAPNWARKAITMEPDNALSHVALSDAYLILNRWNEALTPMQEAVKIDPGNSRIQSGMGHCLILLDKYKEAIPYLRRALELNPEDAYSHARMSVALFNTGDKKGSEHHLQTALELKPDDPQLHSQLGWRFQRKGKRKEAKGAFYEALRLDPQLAPAKLGIGARLGSKFSLAEIFLRSAFLGPQGKRLFVLRLGMALILLEETSITVHGLYLWPVWGVELILIFALYRIARRVLKLLARRRGIHAG